MGYIHMMYCMQHSKNWFIIYEEKMKVKEYRSFFKCWEIKIPEDEQGIKHVHFPGVSQYSSLYYSSY